MALATFHCALDYLAVWTEDRLERPPEACVLTPPSPLGCFGPLPPLPRDAPREGTWSTASPRPLADGDRLWIHVAPALGARRGTAIVVPPWKIRDRDLVSGWTDVVREAGWDAWLVSPPHHLERTAPGARSGEGFVSLDVARLRAVFEQLVLELRLAHALAARRGPVAVVGLSLGGLAAALALTAPEPFDAGVLVAPPALPSVMSETGIGRRYRRLALAAGSPWPATGDFEASLSPLDPARRAPTTGAVLLAAGVHDRIALAAGTLRLASAWEKNAHVYPRGHISLLFLCRALRRDVREFLRTVPLSPAERGRGDA
jgi:hypothetical protein